MTRKEIIKKYQFVKKTRLISPNPGECYIISEELSIENQVKKIEGKSKIFYFKVKSSNDEFGISVDMVGDDVYITPTEY